MTIAYFCSPSTVYLLMSATLCKVYLSSRQTEALLPFKNVLHALIYTDFTSLLKLVFHPRLSPLFPPPHTWCSTALTGFVLPSSFLPCMSASLDPVFLLLGHSLSEFVCQQVLMHSPCPTSFVYLRHFQKLICIKMSKQNLWLWH